MKSECCGTCVHWAPATKRPQSDLGLCIKGNLSETHRVYLCKHFERRENPRDIREAVMWAREGVFGEGT